MYVLTRMHSSGIRTTRLLTVSQHALRRGVYPRMHWAGGCVSQHALGRRVSAWGIPAWGVYLPRGCNCVGGVPAGGYLPRVVYLPGGFTCPGGVPAGGCRSTCPGGCLPGGCLPLVLWGVSQHAMGQTPPMDRQIPLKT